MKSMLMSATNKKEVKRSPLKILSYRNGEVVIDFTPTQKKILVGRGEACDLRINDPSVSHYHAFLIVEESGFTVIDLASENGVFVSSKSVERGFAAEGDIIQLGAIELHLEEIVVTSKKEEIKIVDHDQETVKLSDDDLGVFIPELPPHPGLVVIDGEYCDIVFDDKNFTPLAEAPILENSKTLDFKSYIDVDENKETLPILRSSEEDAVEVVVLSNGVILSIDYFSLKSTKKVLLSARTHQKNSVHVPTLDLEDDIEFISINSGDVSVHKVPDCFATKSLIEGAQADSTIYNHSDSCRLSSQERVVFTYHTVQIMVRTTKAPPKLKAAPFFGRDREFQKQTSQIFGAIMGLCLLLLFVDVTINPPEEKKIAVIYRKAVKSPEVSNEKSTSEVSKVDKDKGVKQEKQPEEEVKMAQKMAEKAPTKQKTSPTPQKSAPAPAASAVKVPEKPKMKAYEFKAKTSLSSLMGSTQALKNNNARADSRSLAKSTGFSASDTDSSAALKADASSNVGSLGSDVRGAYDTSSGAQGLSNKAGIDTTYMDPKTVVLGSMDPELLRKILREYLPQFRHCYQQELERSENAKGVVDLQFRINGNGSVSNVQIASKKAKFSAQGSNCMANVLRVIPFPKPKGGGQVDVKQPLNFFSERNKI